MGLLLLTTHRDRETGHQFAFGKAAMDTAQGDRRPKASSIREFRKVVSGGCCQTNSNPSPLFADLQVFGDEKVAPFAKSGVT
ncbi:hypothetical protein HY29_17015 [Hyphomonas beringensis]|uniref:Uncharacterized protein n=1 Tax=Hyphomonas beringensis TaxID=1280946 RepID=A0A062UBP6_9PROT|nr:hypothetical protein HY29_17015 [Hyphomonas beringensis]